MVIPKEYRLCKEYHDLYVSSEGLFIYRGKPKKVIKSVCLGKKQTARITIREKSKNIYFSAASLVASAFLPTYKKGSYIEYIDGDIHNVCVDNLRVVSKKDFYAARMAVVNYYRKIGTYQYQVERIENVVADATAVLHYFKTGDMSEVNRRVETSLYERLMKFCVKSLHLSDQTSYELAADVISRMYEILLSGHAVSNLEYYCKELLMRRKKHGDYGFMGKVPKEIKLVLNKLDLKDIHNKYNVQII